MGEGEAAFATLSARETGFQGRLVSRFAVLIELTEPPDAPSCSLSSLRPRLRDLRERFGFDDGLYVDVAVRDFGVRTLPVGAVHQLLGDFEVDTRQDDVEAGLQKITAVRHTQVDFGINGDVRWQPDFHPGRHNFEG